MVVKRLALERLRTIASVLAAVLTFSARADVAIAVVFTNVTASAGINHLQHPGNAPGAGLFRTGGAAAGDFDNDGWVDLYVTRLNARDLLYRNMGDGTFQDVAVAAGLTASLLTNGAGWGDIDNDGDKDLYVTASGGTRFYMYVNNGDGTFTEDAVSRSAAISGVLRYGQGVTFGDYDGDGYLDIHTNDWATDASVSTSRLLHNLGAANPGYFEDVTATAGLNVFRPSQFADGSTDSNAYRYTSTFTDLDRDGHPDLAISADFMSSQIFWNNGDGTFTDGTGAAGVGTDEDGMGSTLGDFDGDGRLDWFVSALVDVPGGFPPHSGNRLFRNNGDRTFTDQTDAAGVRNSGWSWGTTFLDHDNDRDLDLIVTNGWDTTTSDQSHLYQNDNGAFTDVSNAAGITDTGLGRGLLSFDYDNDGDLDVFIVNHGAQPILYRNDGGNENDWLRINVQGTTSNRDGIGTFITVDPNTTVAGDEMVREINAGSNFLSQNELTAHFGLGADADTIDLVTVAWPSGIVQQLTNVSPNQVVNLIESAGVPGDYNKDLVVDAADYVVWRNQLGLKGAGLAADGDGDQMITSLDYGVWRTHFGQTAGGSASVVSSAAAPESSTISLLAVGSLIVLRVRRCRWTGSRCCSRKRALGFFGTVIALCSSQLAVTDEPSNEPKPIPATRPELKIALESLKERQPRIPPPASTDGTATLNDYLPTTWGLGGFGNHNFRVVRGHANQVADPTTDRLFTDPSFWVVSRANNCQYCLGHQELRLRVAGLDDDTIAALDSDWSRFDPRQQAVLAYAKRLTLEPQLVDDQEIAALKMLFTDAEIVEITYNISLFNAGNRWTDALGLPQERHFGDGGESLFTTPTSKEFQQANSVVVPSPRPPRPPLAKIDQIWHEISAIRTRAARIDLQSAKDARQVLEDAVSDRKPYEWERALAQVPINGIAQVKTWNTILSDDHLASRLKAELSFVAAVNNRAWYSLGHAIHRLHGIGATTDEIATLLNPQTSPDANSAHILAAKLTADPHLITDADIARVRQKYSDAETTQIVQVICLANLFDRFTEPLGLRLEPSVAEESPPLP